MADFVALETLRTFEPGAYDKVRRNEDKLAGVASPGVKIDANWYEELVSAVGEPRRGDCKEALTELFPRMNGVWGNTHYQSGHLASWDKAKRVCAPRRFPAYFTYAMGPDVFSQAELDNVVALLRVPKEFRARVEALNGETRLSGDTRAAILLDELRMDPERTGDASHAAATLLEVGDVFLPLGVDEPVSTSVPMRWRVYWAIDGQLRRLDPDDRFDVLMAAVEDSPSLDVVGLMMDDVIREHDPKADRHVAEDDRIVSAKAVGKLKRAWSARLSRAAKDGSLLASPGLPQKLYRWAARIRRRHSKSVDGRPPR